MTPWEPTRGSLLIGFYGVGEGQASLNVLHHRLESVIHMVLHVAMQQRITRFVRDELNLAGAIAGNSYGVLNQARRYFVADLHHLKIVTVQVP